MAKFVLKPDSPTFKLLTETGLFQMLDKETQHEIVRSMIDDHNQQVAIRIKKAGC